MEVDIVVIWGRDNKFIRFDVALFDDLYTIDHSSMSNDKEFFDELALSGLVQEIYVGYVPDF